MGGEERVVEELSLALAERGHAVSIATLQQPGEEPPGAGTGLTVHGLRSTSYRVTRAHRDSERRHAPPFPDPETVIDLRRVLRRERPEVVHAHNWLIHAYLPLDRDSRRALVLSLHDYSLICPTKRLLRRGEICSGPGPLKCLACSTSHFGAAKGAVAAIGGRSLEPLVRRHVDVFLPVSTTVEELCEMRAGDLSRTIPNFIGDLPPLPGADPRLAQLPDEPYMLFFGDATVDKGALTLVEAYDSLEDPPPLVMVGRNYLEELGERDGVHLLGPWPHPLVIEAVRRSMFTVAPSIWEEPFGLVALETAAVGRPIVASDIGGLRDIVLDGETGLLVPAGDRAALGAALAKLIGDPELRERLSRAATEQAADFSTGAVVPRFEAAYELALAARRGGERQP